MTGRDLTGKNNLARCEHFLHHTLVVLIAIRKQIGIGHHPKRGANNAVLFCRYLHLEVVVGDTRAEMESLHVSPVILGSEVDAFHNGVALFLILRPYDEVVVDNLVVRKSHRIDFLYWLEVVHQGESVILVLL